MPDHVHMMIAIPPKYAVSHALQQTRQLDRAAHLVASVQMLAQLRLEAATEAQDVWRVWAGATGETDSFHCSAETSAFVKAWRGKTAHHV